MILLRKKTEKAESNLSGFCFRLIFISRGRSRISATSEMELFVIIVNGFQTLTIISKCSILDVAGVLGPPLISNKVFYGTNRPTDCLIPFNVIID